LRKQLCGTKNWMHLNQKIQFSKYIKVPESEKSSIASESGIFLLKKIAA
jgi:hypothetical protein